MKAFTISAAVALLAAFTQAAPAPATTPVSYANVIFEGADYAALYTWSFPLDGSTVKITNTLSVTYIYIPAGATCTFYGIDGSVTSGTGPVTEPVGPPQTQVSGTCHAS